MGGYAAAVKNDQDLKNQQRAQTAALYWNAVQTELPPSTVKDANGNQVKNPAYDEALQKRENALKSYISYLGPEQHATIGNRIHGLIFGPEHQEMLQNATPPVSSQAPVLPGTAATPPVTPTHPFAHNPVYAKIQEGLDTLGKHLKAGAHPMPPPPAPDYASLAAAPTAAEREFDQKQQLQKDAEQARIEYAKTLAGGKNINRYSTELRAYAQRLGKQTTDLSPEELSKFDEQYARELKAPVFKTNPATGFLSRVVYDGSGNPVMQPVLDANGKPFGGPKPASVRITHGFYRWTDAVTGEIHQIPITTESTTMMQPYMDYAKPPKSAQAPDLSAANGKIASGNATSKKLNKKKSKSAPTLPSRFLDRTVIGHTAGLLDKSDAAQLTKVSEDANNKHEAYLSAAQALRHPTATSDQELIFSWVRSNVQGSGRMTQAEFQQAANAGSLPLRAQTWYERAKTGKLPPELEQMMLADIKRSSDVAQQQVTDMRSGIIAKSGGPKSSQAPTPPDSDQKVLVYDPKTGTLK